MVSIPYPLLFLRASVEVLMLTMGCTPSMCSHFRILPSLTSTRPSYTLLPGAMTTMSAMRAGRGALSGFSSQACISTLRGSCRETTLNVTSPWAFLTVLMAVWISSGERGSQGWGMALSAREPILAGMWQRSGYVVLTMACSLSDPRVSQLVLYARSRSSASKVDQENDCARVTHESWSAKIKLIDIAQRPRSRLSSSIGITAIRNISRLSTSLSATSTLASYVEGFMEGDRRAGSAR